jgi:hypothetical protein
VVQVMRGTIWSMWNRVSKVVLVVVALMGFAGAAFLRWQEYQPPPAESVSAARTVKAQFPSDHVEIIGLPTFTGKGLETLVATRGTAPTIRTALFFVNGTLVGSDASFLLSNGVAGSNVSTAARPEHSVGQSFVVSYGLYRPNDADCCPTAGTAKVRFMWTGSGERPLDPIPPRRGAGIPAGR